MTTTFYRYILRVFREDRRCLVVDRNHLRTGSSQSTGIFCLIGACQRVAIGAGTVGYYVTDVGNRWRFATIITGHYTASVNSWHLIRTGYRLIGRTGNGWRGLIIYRDNLRTGRRITTGICSAIRPRQGVAVGAGAIGNGIANVDNNRGLHAAFIIHACYRTCIHYRNL